jgi:hypothetical protein
VLLVACSWLRVACCLLPIAYCLLLVACCLLSVTQLKKDKGKEIRERKGKAQGSSARIS